MGNQLSSKQTQITAGTANDFQATLMRHGLETPQQLRDQVIFQMIRMTLVKLNPTDEEWEIINRQEELFKQAQKQGF